LAPSDVRIQKRGRYKKHAGRKGLVLMGIKETRKHTNESNPIWLSPETNEHEL